jgi:hypothetical protein
MPAPRWSWLLPLATAWVYFCTLQGAAITRIRTLTVVESYGFAAYEQIVRNFALYGEWGQTIHRGYIAHWMWSGHRSLWLFPAAAVYRAWPGPEVLVSLQTGLVALGCIPAFGLGRRGVGGVAGGMLGLLLYAGFGPLWALALQDYQDLVLGVPFALAAVWAVRAGSAVGFVFAGLGCGAAREEWVATLPVIALAAGGGWRDRAKMMGAGLGTVALLAAVLAWLGRDAVGYETPMQTHAGAVGAGLPPIQRDWGDYQRFYAHFLFPANFVGLLSPLVLAPAAGALLVHLTTPEGSGIDVQWSRHIHHMAPVAAFFVAAAIDAAGVAGSFVWPAPGRPRWRALVGDRSPTPAAAAWVAVAALLVATVAMAGPWQKSLALHPRARPGLAADARERPEWALVASIPAGARIATDPAGALLLVRFRESWTYGESLEEKTRAGLSGLDYVLVNKRHARVLAEAEALGGTTVSTTTAYALVRLPRADRLGPGPGAEAPR